MPTPNPHQALRWALIGSGLVLALILFGLAQLHLAILRHGPRAAAQEPVGHAGALAVACRPDGKTLLSIDGHGVARPWDLPTGSPAAAVLLGSLRSAPVPQVDVDPRARLVALNHFRMDLFSWTDEPRPAAGPRFAWGGPSRCGRYVSGFRGADYVVVDAVSGRELKRRRIGPLTAYTTDVDARLGWLAWAAPEGVAVAPLGEGPKRRLWSGPWTGDIPWVEFSPDGRYLGVLASSAAGRRLRIWSCETWRELPPLLVDPDINCEFHWSPDSRSVALSTPVMHRYPAGWFGLQHQDETVNVLQVWDLEKRRPHFDWSQPGQVRGHLPRISDFAWAPDSAHLISVDEQGHLGVWNASEARFIRFLKP